MPPLVARSSLFDLGTEIAGLLAHQPLDDDMPQKERSAKRERQYEHIKDGLKECGKSEERASEIAARTVNKVRAQSGESKTASRSSVEDMSPSRRGGQRSHRGPGGRTYRQLYNEAKTKGIEGRSQMNKARLQKALAR